MFIHEEKSTTKNIDTLVYTDPSADIDDQLAIYMGLKTGIKLTIVVGGTGKLSNWKHFSSLGPVGEPVESFDKGELNCILKPKYIVVIAPNIDDIYDKIDLENCKKVYYMGNAMQDLPNTQVCVQDNSGPSFNDTGAEKFRKAIQDANIVTRICTSAEGKTKMCNMELFNELNLTEAQIDESIKAAFGLCLGRMNPEHVANKFAEQLVSGPRAANLKQLEELRGYTGKKLPIASKALQLACETYISTLERSLTEKNQKSSLIKDDRVGPLFDRQAALDGLMQTSRAATAVLGVEPIDSNGNLIVSGKPNGEMYNLFLDYSNQYESLKNLVKQGLNLSPAFDLITMQYRIDDYKKQNGESKVKQPSKYYLNMVAELKFILPLYPTLPSDCVGYNTSGHFIEDAHKILKDNVLDLQEGACQELIKFKKCRLNIEHAAATVIQKKFCKKIRYVDYESGLMNNRDTDDRSNNGWEDPYREWPTEEWEQEPFLDGGGKW